MAKIARDIAQDIQVEEAMSPMSVPGGLMTADDADLIILVMLYFGRATRLLGAKEEENAEEILKISEELDEMMEDVMKAASAEQFVAVLNFFCDLVGRERPTVVFSDLAPKEEPRADEHSG